MTTAEVHKNNHTHTCCDCKTVIHTGEYMNVITDDTNIKYQCLKCKRKDEGWNGHYKCYKNGHHVDYEKCDEDFI
jgi:hypothetical protein